MNKSPNRNLDALLIPTIASHSRQATPFDHADENNSYANLAALCAECGVDLHVTHFENLTSGTEGFAWNWKNSSWQLVGCPIPQLSLCYADLPQDFPKAIELQQALHAHPVTVVNALQLSDLLTDKLATYDLFSEHVPLTLNANDPDLLARLRGADCHPDLSIQNIFMKPRFGERGRGIYVTDLDDLAAHQAIRRMDYIVQPFLETNAGVPELDITGRHDLRMIICDGHIVLTYASMPAEGSYVSRCSHEIEIDMKQLPERLVDFATMVDDHLCHYGSRLYALDIGIGRSGKIWIYELNTMPGIVWDEKIPESKALFGKMQRILARWLCLNARPKNGAGK